MSEKIGIYLAADVVSIWVVDPKRRIVLVYGGSEKRQYYEHTEIKLPLPLDGSIGIDDIFFGLQKSIFYND